jgi:uncharacterized protein YndB with AHSA1/START domain
MTEVTDLAVRANVTVEIPQEKAFEVFTAGFDSWWPRTHHTGETEPEEFLIELRPEGRCYERAPDGTECDWGRVLVVDAPERFVFAWHLDPDFKHDADPKMATEVEVRFIAEGPTTTRVELEHRGLERFGAEAGERMRQIISDPDRGWPGLLRLYADAAMRPPAPR